MKKLPARLDGLWTVQYANDKQPDLSATRNLTFNKQGYIGLSKPVYSFYSSDDNADFRLPVYFGKATSGAYAVVTAKKVFNLDFTGSYFGNLGDINVGVNTSTNTPDVGVSATVFNAGATLYDGDLHVFTPNNQDDYVLDLNNVLTNTGTWTSTGITGMGASADYPVTVFTNQSRIAVAEDENVFQVTNASAVSGSTLVLPPNFRITGLAYNNGYLGITTTTSTGRAVFAVWDGTTAEANFIIEVPSDRCDSPVGYKGTFAFIDDNGIIWYWSGNSIEQLSVLPSFSNGGSLSEAGISTSAVAEGDRLHFNLKLRLTGRRDEQGNRYEGRQPSGIWTYDPNVGLYHRHAPSGTKVTTETIATTAINTTTDAITVTAAPETGTPVRYSDGGSTAATGITANSNYFVIKVDATTIKLATTYSNAVAGTAIDISGTGNNAQVLQFYIKRDFGSSFTGTISNGTAGAIFLEDENFQNYSYYKDFFFGYTCAIDSNTEVHAGGYVVQGTENRGYFVTNKLASNEMQDTWQKLYIKHSPLRTDLDKLVIKYRTDNNEPVTVINEESTDGIITWSDNTTFTTTDTQFADVLVGDEVEVIQGAGAGYLAHITDISEAAGTYTVTIDETIKNLTASDTGRVVISRWTKLSTITKDTLRNDDGYSEIVVSKKSKQILFKVELRGEDIEIEELLVANQKNKPT